MTEESSYTPRTCPRCGKLFVCRNDDVLNCQCVSVALSAADLAYIAERHEGCLCVHCLRDLARERREAGTPKQCAVDTAP